MKTIMSFILVLGALVFFHEFGHFIVAKLTRIKVYEFSLGFGPALVHVKRGETDYALRAFPLGGYVKMEGEDENSDDPRSFNKQTVLNRLGVIIAGPLMNFLLAVVLISITALYTGTATTTVNVIPGQPADIAGITGGDKVFSVDGVKIGSWDEIVALISQKPEQVIKLEVIRGKNRLTFDVNSVRAPEDQRGIIGITSVIEKGSLAGSVGQGIKRTFLFSKMILKGIGQALTGKARLDVTGPLGMAGIIGEAAETGFLDLLYITSIISINLGLLNLLPIPALDGGRIAFILIEVLKGKPIEPSKEGFVHFIGFALLMAFMVFVLFKDIKDMLSNWRFILP